MESVPQIQKSEFLLDMGKIWLDAGYAFTLVRQDAKFYGLPQQRRRCFMVAHRIEIPWHVPPSIYTEEPYLAGDALEEVREPGLVVPIPEQHHHLLPRIGPGGSMRHAWEEENPHLRGVDGRDAPVVGRPLLMIHRIDPSIPSGVIIGQNVYIHPFEDRFIGHLEAAKLCGYPDGYQWVNGAKPGRNGTANDYIAQIAKAVTPPAGRFLGLNLEAALSEPIEAQPIARRVTCWAPSSRVNDRRLQFYEEPWSVEHECTVLEAEDPLTTPVVV
jgi:site-specific DNA-cytosine methylase